MDQAAGMPPSCCDATHCGVDQGLLLTLFNTDILFTAIAELWFQTTFCALGSFAFCIDHLLRIELLHLLSCVQPTPSRSVLQPAIHPQAQEQRLLNYLSVGIVFRSEPVVQAYRTKSKDLLTNPLDAPSLKRHL